MSCSNLRTRGLVAAVALLSASMATAQGPWATGDFNSFLYVDAVNGFDQIGGGRLASTPLQSIGFAIAEAESIMAASPSALPITINLVPTAPFVSAQELSLPAFGICLESYGPTQAVVQCTDPTLSVIHVDHLLDPTVPAAVDDFPPSVIEGLDISGGRTGIRIDTPPLGMQAPTVRVEIRDCDVHDNDQLGIDIFTMLRNETVIDHNRIFDNGDPINNFGWGLRIVNPSVSSALIRSNRIWHNEVNIELRNQTGDAFNHRDRVFSNFVENGEWNVFLAGTAARFVNNTIAFAQSFSATPFGIVYNAMSVINPTLELRNCIVWNPSFVDIQISGSPTLLVSTCDLNVDPGIDVVTAALVGSNGNFSVAPPFTGGAAPENLHLQAVATTPAIWGGANSAFLRVPGPMNTPVDSTMTMVVAGGVVRVDVPCDVDLDPRHVRMPGEPGLFADIGGDEIAYAALVPVTGLDPLGNMPLDMVSGTWGGTVRATAPAISAGLLFIAFEGDPVNRHMWMDPFGDAQLDLLTPVTVFAVPATPGQIDFNVAFGTFNFPFLEAEVYLQAAVLSGADSCLTNRLTVDLDF